MRKRWRTPRAFLCPVSWPPRWHMPSNIRMRFCRSCRSLSGPKAFGSGLLFKPRGEAVIDLPPADLLPFLDRVEAVRRLPAPVPKWLRSRVLGEGLARCWHCEAAPATRAVYIFSPALGGDASGANVIASCDRCAVRHRHRDPWELAWAEGSHWSEAKAARRLEALATCAQMPVPKARSRSKAQARAWLEETRWTVAPRVGVVAWPLAGGVLAGPVVTGASPGWAALASALRSMGGERVALAPGVVWVPAPIWIQAKSILIERGALVHDEAKGIGARQWTAT